MLRDNASEGIICWNCGNICHKHVISFCKVVHASSVGKKGTFPGIALKVAVKGNQEVCSAFLELLLFL